MKTQILIHIFIGLVGLVLLVYGIGAAMRKIPVFYLIPPQNEKEKRREARFHAIGYGGMGFIALMKAAFFFTGISWTERMMNAATPIITLYLLFALTFKVYKKGYINGDSDDSYHP